MCFLRPRSIRCQHWKRCWRAWRPERMSLPSARWSASARCYNSSTSSATPCMGFDGGENPARRMPNARSRSSGRGSSRLGCPCTSSRSRARALPLERCEELLCNGTNFDPLFVAKCDGREPQNSENCAKQRFNANRFEPLGGPRAQPNRHGSSPNHDEKTLPSRFSLPG